MLDNVAICPIAFEAFEELKTKLRLSRRPRHRRRQIAETDLALGPRDTLPSKYWPRILEIYF